MVDTYEHFHEILFYSKLATHLLIWSSLAIWLFSSGQVKCLSSSQATNRVNLWVKELKGGITLSHMSENIVYFIKNMCQGLKTCASSELLSLPNKYFSLQ